MHILDKIRSRKKTVARTAHSIVTPSTRPSRLGGFAKLDWIPAGGFKAGPSRTASCCAGERAFQTTGSMVGNGTDRVYGKVWSSVATSRVRGGGIWHPEEKSHGLLVLADEAAGFRQDFHVGADRCLKGTTTPDWSHADGRLI